MREKIIHLTCDTCLTEFDENEIKSDDISEDELGRDVVRFKCPKCGAAASSFRR